MNTIGQASNQVLTGRTQQRGLPQNSGTGAPQQAPVNPMLALAQQASRYAGTMHAGNAGMGNLYGYGAAKTNYIQLLGIEEGMADEQIKAQAIQEGGVVANSIVNIIATRKTGNPFYSAWRSALERTKHPRKNLPQDPTLVDFVNRIDSNQGLHHFILIQAGIQFGAEFAYRLSSGDDSVRSNRDMLMDMMYRTSVDSVNLQLMDWLGNIADGQQAFYRLATNTRQILTELEGPLFDQVQQRYVFAGMECPYSKGNLSNISERTSFTNPLFNAENPQDMGFGGNIFDGNTGPSNPYAQTGNTSSDVRDYQQWVARKAAANAAGSQGITPIGQPIESQPPAAFNDYDRPTLTFADLTKENRLQFNISPYLNQIPGTEWNVIEDQYFWQMVKYLRKDDGTQFRPLDTRHVGCTCVYRVDWQAGTFNYRLVKHNLESENLMSALISDPSKLLPFMFEEDGVQKTTFDPRVMEVSEFKREQAKVPMGEVMPLEKEPNLLVGNRPMKANTSNDETIRRVNVMTETNNPKGTMDGFVLPMVASREFIIESSVDMDKFYAHFAMMEHGATPGVTDTSRVIKSLRRNLTECESEEFQNFLPAYMTNLVNRWLVECRGYAETREEHERSNVPYLRIGNIFEDIEELVVYLNQNDEPALRSFLSYETNEFIRNGIQILMPQNEVKKVFEEKYKDEEDEDYKADLMKGSERTIIIKRNSVFINLTKLNGPRNLDAVVIKESVDPMLFAIVRKSVKVAAKHFDDTPQILVKFHKDPGEKVWVLTRSEFDPESVFVLRTVSISQEYCHVMPICG